MRSVAVVCDNHHDRPAVASYYISKRALGHRPLFPMLETPVGLHHDFCAECALVLGWRPDAPPPEPEEDAPVSEKDRRHIFALFGELGYDEDDRHQFLRRMVGDPSMRNLLAKDAPRVIEALAGERDRG